MTWAIDFEDFLAGILQQLKEIDEELAPLEQQLGASMLSPTQRDTMQRHRGRLKHRRDVLLALIEGLQVEIDPVR